MIRTIFHWVLIAAVLSGCGGGGGSTTTSGSSTPVVINGIAAAGAPIVGTVTAKDSKGTTFGPATISPTGTFALTVTNGVAPFVLRASGITAGTGVAATYHTVVPSSSIPTNVNITPLTEIVVARSSSVAPASLYSGCTVSNCSLPSTTQVTNAQTVLTGNLGNLFSQFSVNTLGLDLLTTTFVAGPVATQSPIDVLLDAITIQSTTATNFEIVANSITGLPGNTILVTLPASATGSALSVNAALNASAVASAVASTNQAVLGGHYSGTFGGGDNGTWQVVVSPSGIVSGSAHSNVYNQNFSVSGSVASNGSATFGLTGSAAFTGTVNRSGDVTGTWINTVASLSGNFSGSKQSVANSFAGNHSGTYSGGDTGTWQITANTSGVISGTSTSNAGGACTISGIMGSNGSVTLTSGGTSCGSSFTGSYSPVSGAITGTWSDTVISGTFSGS